MKPLLAHIYEPHRVTYPCYVQPKLNGIRALYQNGRFQSRDQIPFPEGLLDHLAKPLSQVFDPSIILDGELYVHGWPLQRINAAVTPVRLKPTEDTIRVQYHVFDCVNFNRAFMDRMADVLKLLFKLDWNGHQKIQAVITHSMTNEIQANKWYAGFVESNYEGMMYRLGDCPYTVPKQPFQYRAFPRLKYLSDKDNRVWHLLKRKDWQDDEFLCIGVNEGIGKLNGTLGAFQCRINGDLSERTLTSFSVGSGLTDSERKHYWENPPIGQLIKVKYLCLSSDGIPLNPTILCINPK